MNKSSKYFKRKCYQPVVHHKDFQLLDIVDNKLLEFVGEEVASLLVRAVANVGHQSDSLKLTPDT